MPNIALFHVNVEFPVFSRQGRLLKSALVTRTVGGEIETSFDNHLTIVHALRNISLSIRDGERVALIGRNGSGKTTLLRLLGKIYDPTSGRAEIEGSVTSMTDLMMGMDPEESGYNNIRMRAIFLGLNKAQTEALIRDVEDFTELGGFLELPMRTYSQGMVLRLCFAISTSIAPDIVILDEMISVGDAAFFKKAEIRMNRMFEAARIMVIATHDRSTALGFCNRAILLDAGGVIFDGSPQEAFQIYDARVVATANSAETAPGSPLSSAETSAAPSDIPPAPVPRPSRQPEHAWLTEPDNPQATAAAASKLKNWLIQDALPFWSTVGFDAGQQAFHERTDLSGSPILAVQRRTMVQCRQIYAFAHAALIGWFPEGAYKALLAADTMCDRRWRADGQDGWVFALGADGAVLDARRDTYTHAFVLFGLAWAYKLKPERRYRYLAEATFAYMDNMLAAPDFGGFIDGIPRPDSLRRQNPHMHYFEACLAWYEATGDGRYLSRAGEIFGLFSTRFYHPSTGIVGEYFGDSWMPENGIKGRISEPGHHFEWIWLLRKFGKLSDRDVTTYVAGLYSHATDYGVSPVGLIYDEVLNTGEPLTMSHRCWPHTEAIKAGATEWEAGRPHTANFVREMIQTLSDRFLHRAFPGGWLDHVTNDGAAKVDFVPASTLYHVFLAAAEADRVFGSA